MSKVLPVICVLLVSSAHGLILSKQLAARSLSARGLPDPHCRTGVISMKVSGKPQSCCAGYCGTCNDYETCKSARGQASESACCASKIYEMRCGNAPANVCLKTCSESVPPCIMGSDTSDAKSLEIKKVNGVPDCNEAVPAAQAMYANAINKGNELTNIHIATARLNAAVEYAQVSKARLQADLQDPEFPEEYKGKLEEEAKHADQVIEFVKKHMSKTKDISDEINVIEAGQEIPHELRVKLQEMSIQASKDDKAALDSKGEAGKLHYQAYMAVAAAARKEADKAAAAARKAAEEAAAQEAARKASEEAAAAAAKKAAEAAAAQKAAEKAARAAAEKSAAEEAAAQKAAEEAAAVAKAAEEAAKKAAEEKAKKEEEEAAAKKAAEEAAEEAAAAEKAAAEAAAKAAKEASEKDKKTDAKPLVSCVVSSGWSRPYGNVALSRDGAEDCQSKCKSGGFIYFGLECPMGTSVHCQCSNSIGGTIKSDEYCAGQGDPLVHAHGHCSGPWMKDGYYFGDYNVGSVYNTEAASMAPMTNDWNGRWAKVYQIKNGGGGYKTGNWIEEKRATSFPLTAAAVGNVNSAIGSENAKLSDVDINAIASPRDGYKIVYRVKSSDTDKTLWIRTNSAYMDTGIHLNVGKCQIKMGESYESTGWTDADFSVHGIDAFSWGIADNDCSRYRIGDGGQNGLCECVWYGSGGCLYADGNDGAGSERIRCATCAGGNKMQDFAIWVYVAP